MKKKLVKWLAIAYCPLITFVFPNVLHAGIVLNENNLNEVVDEIEYLYGHLIDIPIDDVKDILEPLTFGPFDSDLSAPDAQVTFEDVNDIEFTWSPQSAATSYLALYLHLGVGINGSATTTANQVSYGLGAGWYLFAFQAHSNLGTGSSFIIIEDRPLAFASVEEECRCVRPDLVSNTEVIGDDTYHLHTVLEEDYIEYIEVHLDLTIPSVGQAEVDFITKLFVNQDEALYAVELLGSAETQESCLSADAILEDGLIMVQLENPSIYEEVAVLHFLSDGLY